MPPVKRRYILFKIEPFIIDSKDKLTIAEGEIVTSVREMVKNLHGDFGLASIQLNFYLKKYDQITRTGVLVVKRESYKFVLTAIPLIRTIRNCNVSISVLKLSGTLRGCLRSLQGYHGKMLHEYKKSIAENNKSKNVYFNHSITSKEQINESFKKLADGIKE